MTLSLSLLYLTKTHMTQFRIRHLFCPRTATKYQLQIAFKKSKISGQDKNANVDLVIS